MIPTDHETAMADLSKCEFDARTEHRRQLLTGGDTAPTRAAIAEFGKLLKAEITRDRSEAEVKAETKRSIREHGRRRMAANLAGVVRAEIAKRLAPIAVPASTIPASIKESK
jgi:hypothetical protein